MYKQFPGLYEGSKCNTPFLLNPSLGSIALKVIEEGGKLCSILPTGHQVQAPGGVIEKTAKSPTRFPSVPSSRMTQVLGHHLLDMNHTYITPHTLLQTPVPQHQTPQYASPSSRSWVSSWCIITQTENKFIFQKKSQ